MTTQGSGQDIIKKRGPGRPRKSESSQAVKTDPQVVDIIEGVGSVQDTVAPEPELIPKGMHSGDLFASEDEHEIEIIHKGQVWSFKYKDLSWGDKNYCIDQAQVWEGETFRFSIQKYYASALTRMLTQSPIRPVTAMTLDKLDRGVGDKLIAIVPNPIEDTSVLDEVKKA